MEQPNPTPRPDAGSVAGAIALVVIGLVIFVPTGLCTGLFFFGPIVQPFLDPRLGSGDTIMSGIALVIGGPFVFAGFVMIRAGVRTLRTYFGNKR